MSSSSNGKSTPTASAPLISDDLLAACKLVEEALAKQSVLPSQLMAVLPKTTAAIGSALNAPKLMNSSSQDAVSSQNAGAHSDRDGSSSPSTSGPPSVPGASIVVVAAAEEQKTSVAPGKIQNVAEEEEEEEIKLQRSVVVSKSAVASTSTSSASNPEKQNLTVAAGGSGSPTPGPPSMGANSPAEPLQEPVAVVENAPIAKEANRKRPRRSCTVAKAEPSPSSKADEPKRHRVEESSVKEQEEQLGERESSIQENPEDTEDVEMAPVLALPTPQRAPDNIMDIDFDMAPMLAESLKVNGAQDEPVLEAAQPAPPVQNRGFQTMNDWLTCQDEEALAAMVLNTSRNTPSTSNRPLDMNQTLGSYVGLKSHGYRAAPRANVPYFGSSGPSGARPIAYQRLPASQFRAVPMSRFAPGASTSTARPLPVSFVPGRFPAPRARADSNLEDEEDDMLLSSSRGPSTSSRPAYNVIDGVRRAMDIPRADPLAKYMVVGPSKTYQKKPVSKTGVKNAPSTSSIATMIQKKVQVKKEQIRRQKRELSASPEPSTSTFQPSTTRITPANRSKRSTAPEVSYKSPKYELTDSEEEMEQEKKVVTPRKPYTSFVQSSSKSWSFSEILKNMNNPKDMDPEHYVPYCNAYATRVFIAAKYKERVKKGRKFEADVVTAIEGEIDGLEEKSCFSVEMDPKDIPSGGVQELRELNGFVNSIVNPGTKKRLYKLADVPKGEKMDVPLKMINCTGNVYLDRKANKGSNITQNVVDYGRGSVSDPLDKNARRILVPVEYARRDLIVRETRAMFTQEERKAHPGYLPVAVFNPRTMQEFEDLKAKLEESSICMVRGVDKLCGIDATKFDVSRMSEINKEFVMMGPRIMGQPTSSNYQRNPAEAKKGMWNDWSCAHFQQAIQLVDFAKYNKTISELTEQALDKIEVDPENIRQIIEQLGKDLHSANIQRAKEDEGLPDALSIAFGSNIDITQEENARGEKKFAEQLENIRKLPVYLLPDSNGTLLDFCGIFMPGINTPQVYSKCPLVRTTAHLENGCLGSININLGPGTSIWFSVPVEFAGKFQELVKEKLELQPNDDGFFTFGYWPIEQECLKAGIPLQKWIQEPGDMVFVGPGTYHWVQSNEFTTQVSWNVGSFSYRQLAWLAISHDNYLANGFAPVVPLETLCWNLLIKENAPKVEDYHMRRALKTILMRSLANCKSQEVFARRMDLEILMVEDAEQEILAVERCDHPDCGNHTFNMFFKRKTDEEEEEEEEGEAGEEMEADIYCLACATSSKMLRSPKYRLLMRYKIPFLERVYDTLTL